MRIVLAFFISVCAVSALAGQVQRNVPAELFSPMLMQGWQIQPKTLPEDEALALALAWASPIPHERFVTNGASVDELLNRARHFTPSGSAVASHSGRTVGQGTAR